jgi:creatinine amidohydrolase/Fe(II)-dependent formamide hydrolase-like protein
MDRDWKVVKRIGRKMTLECGQKQRLIREPTRPYAKQLFHMARPGQVIDDETVALFVDRKPKRSRMRVSN